MSRKINSIIVHYSASPDHMDIGAKKIREWHLERGFKDIGYHYVIRRNGEIERGRPEAQMGAHARGHNAHSIGICWIGQSVMNPEQEKSLIGLINLLRGKYNLSIDAVLGHKEVGNTKCPNLSMNRLRAELVFITDKPEVR
jgi:N-acetyl-anhydromuramyl-L-alanine amidase AmpD